MKKEIKMTLIVCGIILFIVGLIGGIVVGLNYKSNENKEVIENNIIEKK